MKNDAEECKKGYKLHPLAILLLNVLYNLRILYCTEPFRHLLCTSQCINFDGYIVTTRVGRSTRFCLDVSAT